MSAAALLASLSTREGEIYRIDLRLHGVDPRVALRAADRLDDATIAALKARLGRLDARGAWTRSVLQSIGDHPGRRAEELAAAFGAEKLLFKRRVRRLRELGLLDVGYRLSPRGLALLNRLPD